MPTVTGTPLAPFADALFGHLAADPTLVGLATGGVYAALPRDVPVVMPYVLVGQRREFRLRSSLSGAGSMQREGGRATVWVDVFSAYNGPAEAEDLQARIRILCQRVNVAVPGFFLTAGSLECEEELVYDEPDPNLPTKSIFHGVQSWGADLEELSAVPQPSWIDPGWIP